MTLAKQAIAINLVFLASVCHGQIIVIGSSPYESVARSRAAVAIARMQFQERELQRQRAYRARIAGLRREQWERTRASQQVRWDTRRRTHRTPTQTELGRQILREKLAQRGLK